ncbi:unnamed protein product [Cylicostephanus goldi]|uniref:Lipid-binding serum glycoprotein C-terminal domain-containing protein n=1 Tax=Cylicostephanus goldi TaxID=71465 RepID=A0A3P7N009_CYLGO|nr:unnamed protein product [Cylicostephanus goldi]
MSAAFEASISVEVSIERGPRGPYLRLVNCNLRIGYIDAYNEYGGSIGNLANSLLRPAISKVLRKMTPRQICSRLPSIIDERLNARLSGLLPQSLPGARIFNLFGSALGLGGPTPSPEYVRD